MNKAFTREPDADADDDDDAGPGQPSLPPGTRNYLTPAGYKRLRDELLALIDDERPKIVVIVGIGIRFTGEGFIHGGCSQSTQQERRTRCPSRCQTRRQ